MRGSPKFAAVLLAGALTFSLAAAASAARSASGPKFGPAAAVSPAWFSRLNLTADQQTKVRTANQTLRADQQKARALTSPDDRKVALRQARQTYRQAIQAALTPEQQSELKTIAEQARQLRGLGPMGARLAALNLTQTQQEKLQEIAGKYQPQIQTLRASLKSAADKKPVREQMRGLHQKIASEAEAVLTSAQLAQLQPPARKLKVSR